MNSPAHDWQPDPQLLAAYFDGELEGRDEVADLRARIEAWVELNPDGAALWAEHRELKKAWLDTTPADPDPSAWTKTLEQIDTRRRQPARPRRSWHAIGYIAACILLLFGLLYGASRVSNWPAPKDKGPLAVKPNQPIDEDFILPVAAMEDVVILRIDGEDIESLVVGELPMSGPMELADSGDVVVTATGCPRTSVHQKRCRPMVWARLDAE